MIKQWIFFVLFLITTETTSAMDDPGIPFPISKGPEAVFNIEIPTPHPTGQLVINMPPTELNSLLDSLENAEETGKSSLSWFCDAKDNDATTCNYINTHRIGTLLSLIAPIALINYSNNSPELALTYCLYNSITLTNLLTFFHTISPKNSCLSLTLFCFSSMILMGLTIASWYYFLEKKLQVVNLWPLHLGVFLCVAVGIGVGMDSKRTFSCHTA